MTIDYGGDYHRLIAIASGYSQKADTETLLLAAMGKARLLALDGEHDAFRGLSKSRIRQLAKKQAKP